LNGRPVSEKSVQQRSTNVIIVTRHPFLRSLVLVATVFSSGVLALVGVSSASAHDALTASAPANGEVVTADPGSVSLTYSDELLTLGGDTSAFAIQVTDASGAFHENGCLTIDGLVASTGIALGDAGSYTVSWQVVSSDGHPTSGSYEFDYQPTDTGNSMPGMAAAPACGEPWSGSPREDVAPVATPEPTMTTMAENPAAVTGTAAPLASENGDEQGGNNIWLVLGVSMAGVILVATVIVLTVRRMRHDPFEKPGATAGDE
jgi:methionine-rich copper-binding protein CopC